MTATIDEVSRAPRAGGLARTQPGAPWRFALRLARREVRRRPGRTALVMLLIAIPLCGMTLMTVWVRTNNDSAAEEFVHEFGAADLAVFDAGAGAGTAGLPPATFPAGTRVVRAHTFTDDIGIAAADGTARLAQVTDLDLNDPIAHGAVLLRSGRFPSQAGEALLSSKLARAFGVGVGDTLRLSTPNWTEKVVGIGVRATDWDEGFVDVRGNELRAPGVSSVRTAITIALIDLPGHPSRSELLSFPPPYESSAQAQSHVPERAVNWVLVGGIVALAIVGIVISGAFAVGARRQLVTLGQLSANGASEQLLRRTLSLQGLLSGAIGSVVGFGAGVGLLLVLHGEFANLIHHDPGRYVWSARDAIAILLTGVITATVAAFIPARSAARVPVLTALAGRRPLGTLPKRLVPIGAGLFAGGVFVLVLVAGASGSHKGDGLALSAVFGGLLVLAGACCASSVVVAGLGRAARATRGAARVALRSVVRSRARSAAVVMALAAVNAGSIAIGTAIGSRTDSKQHNAQFMPNDTLIVSNATNASGSVKYLPLPAAVTDALHKILPGAQFSVRRAVVGPDGSALGPPIGPTGKTGPRVFKAFGPSLVMITDPAVLRMIGLSAKDNAQLQRAGMIAVQSPSDANGTLPATIPTVVGSGTSQSTVAVPVAQDSVRATGDGGGIFMTAAKAHALGLTIVDAGEVVRSPQAFNDSQQASIDVLSQTLFLGQAGNAAPAIVWGGTGGPRISVETVEQIVLGIAVLIALIVLAMSLALSAAETRDERDVLVSLGARPSTMRAVSAWKAMLLAVSGALVAIPTGFIPVAVVYLAVVQTHEVAHVVFPWLTVVQLVVAAPIIAGIVAYAGSAVAQAVRPTRMSTFATD